jgi:uncharacterized alpha-E superfamily protein
MLSRVAENIYWMARYVERAENTARLIQVHANLFLDLPKGTAIGWDQLIAITGSDNLFYKRYKAADERNVVKFVVGDLDNPDSILAALSSARENLRTTRDLVPREAFEQINDLYLYAKQNAAKAVSRRGRYDFLTHIILGSQLNAGLLTGSMSHDAANDFIQLGCSLERADMTTRIVDVRSALLPEQSDELSLFESIQWMSVLKSLSAYHMYRRYVRERVRGMDVLRFALQNETFPRSVYHCIKVAEACLRKLPRHDAPLRGVVRLERFISEADIANIRLEERLAQFIDDLQIGISQIHNQISATYFDLELPVASQAA